MTARHVAARRSMLQKRDGASVDHSRTHSAVLPCVTAGEDFFGLWANFQTRPAYTLTVFLLPVGFVLVTQVRTRKPRHSIRHG